LPHSVSSQYPYQHTKSWALWPIGHGVGVLPVSNVLSFFKRFC
jgi:hypothetical protein